MGRLPRSENAFACRRYFAGLRRGRMGPQSSSSASSSSVYLSSSFKLDASRSSSVEPQESGLQSSSAASNAASDSGSAHGSSANQSNSLPRLRFLPPFVRCVRIGMIVLAFPGETSPKRARSTFRAIGDPAARRAISRPARAAKYARRAPQCRSCTLHRPGECRTCTLTRCADQPACSGSPSIARGIRHEVCFGGAHGGFDGPG